jgi:hypothetical protein
LVSLRRDIARRSGGWEAAYAYVDKANDRFLNKARGLLAFNGLTLAALRFGSGTSHVVPTWGILFGLGLAIVSAAILLITHFLINFGPPAASMKCGIWFANPRGAVNQTNIPMEHERQRQRKQLDWVRGQLDSRP